MGKNESILDIICEAITNDFQEEFLKQNKNTKLDKILEIQEDISNKILEKIKNKELCHEIINNINRLVNLQTEEVELWRVECFKEGYFSAMKLVKETQEKLQKEKVKNKKEKGFFDYCEDYFCDYFDRESRQNLTLNEDYKKAKETIINIKKKYPKIREILDSDKYEKLNKEEREQIVQIREAQGEMDLIELIEAYKLGLKDGLNL